MKSMSRGSCDPDAVTRTMLSPQRMTTEPPACLAHLPVSIMISLPPTMAVSRTNPIDVSFSIHVAGASIERPEPSIQPSISRGLDGTIKPTRSLLTCDATWLLLRAFIARQLPKAKTWTKARSERDPRVSVSSGPMQTDTPGSLDVKLTVVTKDPAPWLQGLAAVGE